MCSAIKHVNLGTINLESSIFSVMIRYNMSMKWLRNGETPYPTGWNIARSRSHTPPPHPPCVKVFWLRESRITWSKFIFVSFSDQPRPCDDSIVVSLVYSFLILKRMINILNSFIIDILTNGWEYYLYIWEDNKYDKIIHKHFLQTFICYLLYYNPSWEWMWINFG